MNPQKPEHQDQFTLTTATFAFQIDYHSFPTSTKLFSNTLFYEMREISYGNWDVCEDWRCYRPPSKFAHVNMINLTFFGDF